MHPEASTGWIVFSSTAIQTEEHRLTTDFLIADQNVPPPNTLPVFDFIGIVEAGTCLGDRPTAQPSNGKH